MFKTLLDVVHNLLPSFFFVPISTHVFKLTVPMVVE